MQRFEYIKVRCC